jgi:hypothetical protein
MSPRLLTNTVFTQDFPLLYFGFNLRKFKNYVIQRHLGRLFPCYEIATNKRQRRKKKKSPSGAELVARQL